MAQSPQAKTATKTTTLFTEDIAKFAGCANSTAYDALETTLARAEAVTLLIQGCFEDLNEGCTQPDAVIANALWATEGLISQAREIVNILPHDMQARLEGVAL